MIPARWTVKSEMNRMNYDAMILHNSPFIRSMNTIRVHFNFVVRKIVKEINDSWALQCSLHGNEVGTFYIETKVFSTSLISQ